MATVMINIDSKTLRFACEEGDEDRLLNLAKQFDSHISCLKKEHGEIGDYRLSVMAGLMILDEMHELQKRFDALATENKNLSAACQTARQNAEEQERNIAKKIDAFALRIITSADKIAPKSR